MVETFVFQGEAMYQKIMSFHLDEEDHWVADLECGHTQHVRHNPPWQNRRWVTSEIGREEHIGIKLKCKKCVERDTK